jgi:hypothetical protein
MASETEQSTALAAAGEQVTRVMDYKRYTPSQVRELFASRVAANPGVAAQPDTSLVTASVRIMECEADTYVLWRQVERLARFNAASTVIDDDHTATVMNLGDTLQFCTQLETLPLPLRAAMHALEARRSAGTLRATALELSYFNARRVLREHGSVLLAQRRVQELRRETALGVALELGARAMEAWRLWISFAVPGFEEMTMPLLHAGW